MIIKLENKGKSVSLWDQGEKGADFDEMVKKLPQDQPLYIFFDFNFIYENREISKTILVNWMPASCKIHSKMLYSTSKGNIKNIF